MKNRQKHILALLNLSRASGRNVLSSILGRLNLEPDWSLSIIQVQEHTASETVTLLENSKADGFISAEMEVPEIANFFERSTIPLVVIGTRRTCIPERTENLAFVTFDEDSIGATGAKYLLSLGNFAAYGFIHYTEKPYAHLSFLRKRGFRRTLLKAGRDCTTYGEPGEDTELDRKGLEQYLLGLPKPAAIMAGCDKRAVEVIDAARRLKLSVPGDFSLLAVDNDEILCGSTRPRLTSISTSIGETGSTAVEELKRIFARRSRKPRTTIIDSSPRVVERESSAFALLSIHAETLGWSNTGTSSANFYDAANWTNSTGEAAGAAPITEGSAAVFPAYGYQMHPVALCGTSVLDMTVDSVSGAANYRLNFGTAGDAYGAKVVDLNVGDVNGYKGEWNASGSKKTLVLTAASGVQTLDVVKNTQQFSVKVENAATTADILQYRAEKGSLRKTGPGDLRVRDIPLPGERVLEIEEGNVQIDGVRKEMWSGLDTTLAKAAVHLDASVRSTWETGAYTDDADRTRIIRWNDVGGNGAYAEIWDNSGDKTDSHIKDIQPPFVSPMTSSTGLPLVDFGAATAANEATYGPQAVMRLHSRIASAQEIFFISALTDGTQVIGDESGRDFNAAAQYEITYCGSIIDNGGFVRLNGNRNWQELSYVGSIYRMTRTFDAFTADKTQLQLTNIKFGDGDGRPVRYLASDRLYKTGGSGSGGVRMGELLIFTEALTEEERKEVTDYLMKKWFSTYAKKEFREVDTLDDTSITVPAGRIARVDTLRVKGSKFTKKGEGTLQIGRVYPEDLAITVEGGDVKLDTEVLTGTVSAPVGTPQYWLDAEAAGAFEKSGDDVTAWCDSRNSTVKTSRFYPDKLTAYPFEDTESLPGHTVLTFPNKSAFLLPGGSQRETFVVFSYPTTVCDYNVVGNGYKTDRGNSKASSLFAKYDIGADEMGGGFYSVNGVPVRPFEATGSTFELNKWYVAQLSTTAAFAFNVIASNGPRSNSGNVKIAEIVTYTTELTPEERAKNIDYLMNKWLGLRHPAFAAPAKNPALDFDGDAVIGSDEDAVIAEVTGSGSITKTGSGSVTISAELTDSLNSIVVDGGSLTIAKPVVPPDRSVFHFDAQNAASFAETFTDGEGLTRLQRWNDTRANGVYATKVENYLVSGARWFGTTNPVIRTVTFPDGVDRTVVDFFSNTSGRIAEGTTPTGAGLYMNAGHTDIVEAHAIFADNNKDTGTIDVFTGRNNEHFKRGTSGTLFRTGNVNELITTGYISVDNRPGSEASYVSGENNDFHLISIAPKMACDMGTIGVDRNITAGGARYGEYIGFNRQLPEAERAYLQQKLMHKWFGDEYPAPVWFSEVDSLSVAEGATLTLRAGLLSVPVLAGGGTIAAAKVAGIETVNLAAEGNVIAPLTVEGTAVFADEVTVNVAGANLKPAAGERVLFTATALENVDLSKWTLVGDFNASRKCSLARQGNSIVMKASARGTILIVR